MRHASGLALLVGATLACCDASSAARSRQSGRARSLHALQTGRGLSGSACNERGEPWVIAERDREVHRLRRGPKGWTNDAVRAVRGVAEGVDTESLASLGGDRYVAGTETMEAGRATDVIYELDGRADPWVVTGSWPLSYDLWQLRGARNQGIEGLCAAGDVVLAGVEQVISAEGARYAPLALYRRAEQAWVPYRLALTTRTGKLSALDCTLEGSALQVVAIERHYGVGVLLGFTVPLPPRSADLKPTVLASLFEEGGEEPNYEAVMRWRDRRLVVSDNDTGGARGPTWVLDLPR